MLKCKKAQIGNTLTWLVATIIIFVILFFFIFGSSLMGKTKNVGKFKEKLISRESSIEDYNILLSKTIFTYFQIEEARDKTDFYRFLNESSTNSKYHKYFNQRLEEIRRGLYS